MNIDFALYFNGLNNKLTVYVKRIFVTFTWTTKTQMNVDKTLIKLTRNKNTLKKIAQAECRWNWRPL